MAPLLLLLAAAGASASPADKALSVLEERCARCHGPAKGSGGLRLTDRAQALKGGEHGPALVPGRAGESLIARAIGYGDEDLQMPPDAKLSAAEIAAVRAWIDAGGPWPAGRKLGGGSWWAFRPARRPPVPRVPGAATPIDAYLDEKLHAREIPIVPEADRHTLARRATFDLHGLPPTAEELRAFVEDPAPDAFERLVERLLASPRYGEKWGRHWLDLVRYADSTGFEQDPFHLEAWRYRDYVIRSFNEDKPYDRFVKEQLAGDELWPDDPQARTGTGFLRIAPNRDYLNRNEEVNRIEKLTDYVETTSSVFLGLTVGCARCHDHKFDPIPQRDFYRLQAIFEPAVYDSIALNYEAGKNFERQHNSREFRLRQLGPRLAVLGKKKALTADETAERKRIEEAIAGLLSGYAGPPMAEGMTDPAPVAPPTYVALRGNPQTPGEQVRPGFLTALGGGDVAPPAPTARTTGRRKALAEWLARPEHPLFARVMANRIWQLHFGRGLLGTPSDFGLRAGMPSHPELLDWLATELAARRFSIKAMHRLIMGTAAYRRAAALSREAREKDPENVYVGRFARRRLLAEELRDTVLSVAGTLSLEMGGLPVVPPLDASELEGIQGRPHESWPVTPDPAQHGRRSVYLLSLRTFRPPMFEAFDRPDGVASCSRRHESTTAPQSLALLNSRFMIEQAAALAARIATPVEAWRRVLGRAPTAEEQTTAEAFLAEQTRRLGDRRRAIGELARALLNTNELLYVD